LYILSGNVAQTRRAVGRRRINHFGDILFACQPLPAQACEYFKRVGEKIRIVVDRRIGGGFLPAALAEGFDAGIRSAENVPLDMVSVLCSPPIRFVVVGAPSYFKGRRKPITPDDLREHSCIRNRLPSGALYRWEFQRGDERISIDPNGPLTLDNHHLMVAAALQGAGLIWTSIWNVEEALAAGKLVHVLEQWSPQVAGLSLYYPSHRHVPAGMKAFLAVVQEYARDLPRIRNQKKGKAS
jgi:DNA-binding transcriptional LysR family regulator